MDGRHMASKKEVLCVHEAGDRQPALGASRARYIESLATTFAVPNPEKKLDPKPAVQSDEQPLGNSSRLLRTIWTESPDQLLPLHLSLNRYCCHSFHFEIPLDRVRRRTL
jgi:hypothetical protein